MTCAMLMKLETLQVALEQATMASEMARATEEGTRQLRKVNMNADTMDTIMEDARDAIEGVDDVTRILSEPMGSNIDVSDELDQMFATPVTIVLPAVPVQPAPVLVTETERELINLPC